MTATHSPVVGPIVVGWEISHDQVHFDHELICVWHVFIQMPNGDIHDYYIASPCMNAPNEYGLSNL